MSNKKKILLTTVLLIALVVSFIGGQTYSKYISQVEGNGNAEIAKWSFKVNGQNAKMQKINLSQTSNPETLINGKMAPGTKGTFEIIIDTTEAEVGTEYQVKFNNENNKPENLVFIFNEKRCNTLKELETYLKGTIYANEENKIKALTIDWDWKHETGNNKEEIIQKDLVDTRNGLEFRNYTFDIVVTGVQIIPK